MIRSCSLAVALLLAFTLPPSPAADEKPKNPFGLKVDPKLDDEAAAKFAKSVTLPGGPKDPNAMAWPTAATEGKADSLAGDWSGRWNYANPGKPKGWVNQTKATKVAIVGDRVYILFTYFEGPYLIVAKRVGAKKDMLAGQVISAEGTDPGFWAGRIIDNERIDGVWKGAAGSGRWDFRRKIKK